MLKSAIEKIQDITKPDLHEVEGRTFAIGADGISVELRPSLDITERLSLTSLDAIVKMIQSEALKKYQSPFYIMIPDHLTVDCFLQPDSELRNIRQKLYRAKATDVPGWEPNMTLPFEEAMIALRTRFQATNDTTYALKLLSDISTGAKITFNDNGIATTVVTKKGIDLQTNEAIRPIISLKPYRTFQEIEQPDSEFLIRVNDRGISFIEADGGMWKLKARETIKDYFENALSREIKDSKVIVAL